jgi:2-polyprenyl-3-methyl-5-hydroxy-6-metoxy-1,4-benzoquinol methylase
MSLRDYYESVWGDLPEGIEPPFAALRLAYLRAEVVPGQRVLDLGCGEGFFAAALATAGCIVVGADVAEEPLRRARRRLQSLDLQLIDAERRWPLPDAGFDVVWAGEVIEHVLDTSAWLSELRRVLKPGGTLLLSTPAHDRLRVLALGLAPRAFEAHFDPLCDHLRFYTRRSLSRLLGDFRFLNVRIRGVGGLPGARTLMLASAKRARF